MPGTSMVDDFRLSQDPIMKRAWKERFEPNFETYKTLKVGYGKFQHLIETSAHHCDYPERHLGDKFE